MYFPTRYATKLTAASLSLFAVTCVFTLVVNSQEPAAAQKPTPGDEKKPAIAASTQPPAASTPTPKLGTELDDRSLITNTDLITLTVTVTDTYGRYV